MSTSSGTPSFTEFHLAISEPLSEDTLEEVRDTNTTTQSRQEPNVQMPSSLDEWITKNHWQEYREGLVTAGFRRMETFGSLESSQVETALEQIAIAAGMAILDKLVFINKGKELYEWLKFRRGLREAGPAGNETDEVSYASIQDKLSSLCFTFDSDMGYLNPDESPVDSFSLEVVEKHGVKTIYAKCKVCSRTEPKLLSISNQFQSINKHLRTAGHRDNVGYLMSVKNAQPNEDYRVTGEESEN